MVDLEPQIDPIFKQVEVSYGNSHIGSVTGEMTARDFKLPNSIVNVYRLSAGDGLQCTLIELEAYESLPRQVNENIFVDVINGGRISGESRLLESGEIGGRFQESTRCRYNMGPCGRAVILINSVARQ